MPPSNAVLLVSFLLCQIYSFDKIYGGLPIMIQIHKCDESATPIHAATRPAIKDNCENLA